MTLNYAIDTLFVLFEHFFSPPPLFFITFFKPDWSGTLEPFFQLQIPLSTSVHWFWVVCDRPSGITTFDSESKHQTHDTGEKTWCRWAHVVSIINLALGLCLNGSHPAWSKLGSYQSPTHFPTAMTDLQGHWRATGSCLLWSWSTFACAAELGRRGMTVITFRCIQLSQYRHFEFWMCGSECGSN